MILSLWYAWSSITEQISFDMNWMLGCIILDAIFVGFIAHIISAAKSKVIEKTSDFE